MSGVTGILLVGGGSRRFGFPKALARLAGETLAERAWRVLGEVCDERLAVGKAADALELPFPVVDDGTAVRAPLAGVVAGLRSAQNELCLVLPVDCPLITEAELRALAAGAHGADACVPQTGPLPGAYRRSALPLLGRRLSAGALALRDALAQLRTNVVDLDPERLVNVNSQADLERVARAANL